MRINKDIILLLVLVALSLNLTACLGGHEVENVRAKIKNHLYEKYGEEFVVDRIGTRSSRGQEFYQARIYPKSILGTEKEADSYYYASASVDKLSFGRLGGVGDSYSYITRNIDMEKYLLPQVKETFGERTLVKVNVEHKVTGDGSWWAGYKSKSLEEMKREVKKDPEHNRIELDLDVYIFDKIEDKAEKEEKRQQIFEFVQYLKDEGLFEYLEMRVVIVDERTLAPSYNDFEWDIRYADKVKKEIEGETVRMPPMDLREKMSKQLQEEVNKMSEEELLASMKSIRVRLVAI